MLRLFCLAMLSESVYSMTRSSLIPAFVCNSLASHGAVAVLIGGFEQRRGQTDIFVLAQKFVVVGSANLKFFLLI